MRKYKTECFLSSYEENMLEDKKFEEHINNQLIYNMCKNMTSENYITFEKSRVNNMLKMESSLMIINENEFLELIKSLKRIDAITLDDYSIQKELAKVKNILNNNNI